MATTGWLARALNLWMAPRMILARSALAYYRLTHTVTSAEATRSTDRQTRSTQDRW